MNPIKLTKEGTNDVVAYACGSCGLVQPSEHYADICCTCSTCNESKPDVKRSYARDCRDCFEAKVEQRELERFNSAEKITEWSGPVYDGSDYHANLGDMMDQYSTMADDPDLPDYVWACDEKHWVKANEDMIFGCLEGDAPEYFSFSDLNGLDELNKAIEAFNEANKDEVSWWPNYKKAVLINKPNN